MAEREGFEPPVPFGTMVFKTTGLNRSPISPSSEVYLNKISCKFFFKCYSFFMHEASIAKYVFDIINETVNNDPDLKGKKVKKITFKTSYPPTVHSDSFEFYFEELIKDTFIENSKFEYIESNENGMGFFIDSIDV